LPAPVAITIVRVFSNRNLNPYVEIAVREIEEKPMTLAGKVALVTGSSQGIGQGIVLRLAQAGADVVINYRSHPEVLVPLDGYSKTLMEW
jgi:3-oxoacyl-ACP reductase-like protein